MVFAVTAIPAPRGSSGSIGNVNLAHDSSSTVFS
uniref:Uncharacterized protein n=1 Tax=Arundo donax TaxID=35708 RepID=A0A0A8ZWT0_ARUDO